MARTCYRHPNRETGVSCSNCGRPICPDCMTPTPVGMRCPECAQQRTRVVRNPTGTPSGFGAFPATAVLIAINVVVYLIEIGTGSGGLSGVSGGIGIDFGLFGPFVAEGEWYRLVTAGFLHAGFLHLGFNMLLLFFLGFATAYERYQDRLILREGLLVAFFLAGLVVLGGQPAGD